MDTNCRPQFRRRLDGFAWMFALLITGIGFLVVAYARYYLSPEDPVPRFFSFLLAFMGAMLGVVLSGNLIQLVFFWELTSLFSLLLIGYWHHNAGARDGARVALTVTATGGFCLFTGVLILGHMVGNYDLDRVLVSGNLIRSHVLYLPALVLALLGALTESAQFPFQFWLPRAMAAPTPFRLPAFGDHGEGRDISAGAPVASDGGNRLLALTPPNAGST